LCTEEFEIWYDQLIANLLLNVRMKVENRSVFDEVMKYDGCLVINTRYRPIHTYSDVTI